MREEDIRFSGIGTAGDKMMAQKSWTPVRKCTYQHSRIVALERKVIEVHNSAAGRGLASVSLPVVVRGKAFRCGNPVLLLCLMPRHSVLTFSSPWAPFHGNSGLMTT